MQVNSKTRKPRYTAEFFAYKHFSHFVQAGTEMLAYAGREHSQTPVVVFRDKAGQYIVTAGNFTDKPSLLSVKIGKKFLNLNTAAHSFNTYVVK